MKPIERLGLLAGSTAVGICLWGNVAGDFGAFAQRHRFVTPMDGSQHACQSPQPLSVESASRPLASAAGIDYSTLAKQLDAGDFRRADSLTKMLLEALEDWVRSQRGDQIQQQITAGEGTSIAGATLANLPCADLKTIDQLWHAASQGKFGFRVQANFWQEAMPQTPVAWLGYAQRLGWTDSGTLDDYKSVEELTFRSSAPAGHLPGMGTWYITRWPKDTFGPNTGTPVDIGSFDRSIYTTNGVLRRFITCERSAKLSAKPMP